MSNELSWEGEVGVEGKWGEGVVKVGNTEVARQEFSPSVLAWCLMFGTGAQHAHHSWRLCSNPSSPSFSLLTALHGSTSHGEAAIGHSSTSFLFCK